MVLSWIFLILVGASLASSLVLGNGSALSSAITQGAQSGITLLISMAGSLCLWSGVGNLMEHAGIMKKLSQAMLPVLGRIFPSAKNNTALANALSGNVCANFLGLGNAATPMGIQAARHLSKNAGGIASHELCRLIVLNTASIQFIPSNVAALRSSLGCNSPFDILPAVWVCSIASAGLGVAFAWFLGKVWRK